MAAILSRPQWDTLFDIQMDDPIQTCMGRQKLSTSTQKSPTQYASVAIATIKYSFDLFFLILSKQLVFKKT